MSSIEEGSEWPQAAAPQGLARIRTALAEIVNGKSDKAVAQRTAFWAFAIRVSSAGLAFVAQILLARWLGQHEYGIFAFVWVFLVMVGALTPLGFSTMAQRFVPQYRTSGDLDLARGFLTGSRVFVFAVASGLALLGCALVALLSPWVGQDYVLPLYIALACLPIYAVMDVQDGISRNFNWVGIGLGLPYLVRPFLIIAIVAAIMLVYGEVHAVSATYAMALAVWASGLAQLLMLNRSLRRKIEPGGRRYAWRAWITASVPVLLVDGFYVILTNVDIMILTAMAGPSDVAIYYAAVKVLALVSFIPFAVTAATAHKYSEYHAAGQRAELESFVRDSVRWTFWPALTATGGLLIVGKPLLWLFGEGFGDAYPLLFIFALGLLARASVGPVDRILNMMGQQNRCAVVYGTSLALNIALNIALIPFFGLYGAAIATAATLLVESFLLALVAWRQLGLHVFIVDLRSGRPGASAKG
ncbi:oligosaccharide flippase family protein [Lutibaculum baratangense]|uniref:Uncharacterized protein n=1 Tax=Lutibaculum baratangense AMV1 TaxID=631454 RepID=V4TCU9_9HYPH|nr:oligosaccharide flippase family protein [Lutibaculum baratangense]ESR24128.1 hypothetical protein N177_2577 [Lutibaculum baratangense AMV1]